jgi:dTMP kinase
MASPTGFFITFEGVEGAGKSTQCRLLADALAARGREVLVTREPGGTPLGEELRALVKHFQGPGGIVPEAELLMFCAARAQIVRQTLLPLLCRGGVVICDRFADSTTVYQGFARGLDPAVIRTLQTFATAGRMPDLTFVLDLDADAGLARTKARAEANAHTDRFEQEGRAFHETIRAGFLKLAAAEPGRFRVLSAARPPDELHRLVLAEVDNAVGLSIS